MSKRKAQSVRIPQRDSRNFLRSIPFRVYSMVFITVLGIIIYSNSFDCSFHLDDFRNITENQTIRDLHNPKDITTFSYHSAMRIVGFLTFALNYHFNGLNVAGYHAVNLLIHIGASLFAWWLAFLILSTPAMRRFDIAQHRNMIALGCGLLFVAHPVQTQAVTYIVQRFASLASLFYLASLCFYLKARLTAGIARKILYFIGFLGAALAGMFTKEIAFTLPLAVLFLELAFVSTDNLRGLLKKKALLYGIILFGVLAILIPGFILTSFYNLKDVFSPVDSDRFQDPTLTSTVYLLTQFRVIVTYIRLLFLPVHQNVDYDFPASQGFFEPATFASFLVLTAILIATLLMFPRRRFEASGIILFFLTLTIESSIKPLRNVIFEHRLYLPLFGFSLFFTGLLYHIVWKRSQKTALAVFIVILCIFSVLTFERNKVWKNELTLWGDSVKKSPSKARPHNNLGKAYYENGMLEQGNREFETALMLNPSSMETYNNIGYNLYVQGRYKEAVGYFEQALSINPYSYDVNINLGAAYVQLGEYEKARVYYARTFVYAFKTREEAAEKIKAVATHLVQIKEYKAADSFYSYVLEYYKNDAGVMKDMGIIRYNQKKYEDAVSFFSRGAEIHPGDPEMHNLLGKTLFTLNDATSAEQHFREAARLKPDYLDAYINLANCLQAQGKKEEAAEYLTKANELLMKLRQSGQGK